MIKAEEIYKLIIKGRTEKNEKRIFSITPEPLDLERFKNSGAASIDLCLGTWFVTLRQARMPCLKIKEKNDEKDESKEKKAELAKTDQKDESQSSNLELSKTHYVPFGRAYYLHPGSFVLGITLEWISLPINYSGYVIGKSSWGRRGLIIATATGVHPGFKGCLTLELTNVGEIPIEIKPGMEICQLCLHKITGHISDKVDTSQFVGNRKPVLGDIKLSPFAQMLASAYPSP